MTAINAVINIFYKQTRFPTQKTPPYSLPFASNAAPRVCSGNIYTRTRSAYQALERTSLFYTAILRHFSNFLSGSNIGAVGKSIHLSPPGQIFCRWVPCVPGGPTQTTYESRFGQFCPNSMVIAVNSPPIIAHQKEGIYGPLYRSGSTKNG